MLPEIHPTGPMTEENVSRLLTDALIGTVGGYYIGKVPILQNASIIERAGYVGAINALQGVQLICLMLN